MQVIIPLFVFSFLGAMVFASCLRSVADEERRWLALVLFFGFGLRLLAATTFELFPDLRLFHEDGTNVERMGLRLQAAWTGKAPPIPLHRSQNFGFFYVAGALYYIFGPFPVIVAYFNSIVGVLTAFLIYRLARRFFHVRVARLASLLVVFTPSMILWSSVALKDALVTLMIVISLSSAISLKTRVTAANVLGTVLPVAAIQPIRFYMVYFVIFSVLVSLVLDRGVRVFAGIYKQIFMAGVAVALFTMVGLSSGAQEGAEMLTLERVSTFRRGMAATAQSGFSHDVDVSTPMRAALFLPIGAATLLLGPFPWQMTSLRALIAAPETVVWWFLFPSMIRGFRFVFKNLFAEASPLLLFTVSMTCAYSLIHGNVGSGFRQRAQIFVFLFIFTALGWFQAKCRRAGIDERHLLRRPPPDLGVDPPPAQARPPASAVAASSSR